MSNRIIIFTTVAFLFISFVFLSATEMKQSNLNSKDVWMLYFSNPKSASLDFTIENHSKNAAFHYEIFLDKTKVKEGDTMIPIGEIKTIPVSAENITNKKIIIDVTNNNEKKEIYKSL